MSATESILNETVDTVAVSITWVILATAPIYLYSNIELQN